MPKTTEKPERKRGEVYLYTQVISLPAVLPGPDGAAVAAALNAGKRPIGPAYVESQDQHAAHVVLTWAVPVEAV